MTKTIYINDKPVFCCNQIDENLSNLIQENGFESYHNPDFKTLTNLISQWNKKDFNGMVIVDLDLDALLQSIRDHFTPIDAAGGIVENQAGKWLFIYRRNKWDLPKGKVDDGESILNAAAREIAEETGVTELTCLRHLTETYHIYEAFGQQVFKTTHWYFFKTSFEHALIPQTEEDISEIKWVSKEQIPSKLSNSYENIRQVVNLALQRTNQID